MTEVYPESGHAAYLLPRIIEIFEIDMTSTLRVVDSEILHYSLPQEMLVMREAKRELSR